jgi:integrase
MLTLYDLMYQYIIMKAEDIKNDPDFIDFCKRRNLKHGTIVRYIHALHIYTELLNKTLSELIEEAEEEEDNGIRLRRSKIRKHLQDFKEYLNEQGFKPSYIKTTTSCIRAYYAEYEIQLPKTFRTNARSDKVEILFDDLPTMEDIKHILQYANPAFKAIMLLGVSSGMGRAEICSLTFKHLCDAISLDPYPKTLDELIVSIRDKTDIIPLWQIKRIKTDHKYFTYSSPESLDAIMNYLEDLNRKVKRYVEKDRIANLTFKPDTNLFLNRHLCPISPTLMSLTYQRLNEKAGFSKSNDSRYIRPHILRKVFASTLEKNKMPHLMTRWLMGHNLDSTTSAYFKADPQTIKEEYLKALNYLTTNAVEIKLINQYEDLAEKLDQKDDEIIKLKAEKDEEMAEMKRELKLVKDLLIDRGVRKELDKR